MQNILRKVKIVFCKGAADIILSVAAFFDQPAELRQNNIVAALSIDARTHSVVDFFASVN